MDWLGGASELAAHGAKEKALLGGAPEAMDRHGAVRLAMTIRAGLSSP